MCAKKAKFQKSRVAVLASNQIDPSKIRATNARTLERMKPLPSMCTDATQLAPTSSLKCLIEFTLEPPQQASYGGRAACWLTPHSFYLLSTSLDLSSLSGQVRRSRRYTSVYSFGSYCQQFFVSRHIPYHTL